MIKIWRIRFTTKTFLINKFQFIDCLTPHVARILFWRKLFQKLQNVKVLKVFIIRVKIKMGYDEDCQFVEKCIIY